MLELKKEKQIGGEPITVIVTTLKVILKIILKILKIVLIKKPFGLLHPLSMTFFTITIPIVLIILTIKNKKIGILTKKYLNIDIAKSKSYFKKESLKELVVVYGSYFILSQIFFVVLLNPSSSRKIKRGKFTSMGLIEVPEAVFNIFSLVIIPRLAQNYIEKNMIFQFDRNKKIAAQILYYTAILGIIGLNNIWNYANLLISLFFTFILLILIEKDLSLNYPSINLKKKNISLEKIKYKQIFSNLFGFEFPSRQYMNDYIKICAFLFIFCFVFITTYSKYLPFYEDYFDYELNVLEVIIKILFSIWIPIQFKNFGKGTNYESEMFLLGNLVSIFIPIFFSEIVDGFEEGMDMISDEMY